VYHFGLNNSEIEALIDAAQNIGIPSDMAQELVLQTMLGSSHLLQKSGKTPAELRKMVTSPGGTTAANKPVRGCSCSSQNHLKNHFSVVICMIVSFPSTICFAKSTRWSTFLLQARY
jgi:hypothetical protein